MELINFQMEEGGKVYDVKFNHSITDEEVEKYFEQKCGGVHKWWRFGGGDVETGFCDICGRGRHLQRKYYRYPIPCDCCNKKEDNHFEIVRHCAQCTPVPPKKLTVVMKPIDD